MTAGTPAQAQRRRPAGSRKRTAGSLTHADMGRVIRVAGYGEGILWGIEHVAAVGDIAAPWTRLILRRTWHGADEATRGLPPETAVSVISASAVAAAQDEDRKVLGIAAGAGNSVNSPGPRSEGVTAPEPPGMRLDFTARDLAEDWLDEASRPGDDRERLAEAFVAGHDERARLVPVAAAPAQPAPDARRALLDIIGEIALLDEPGPAADYICLLARYGLGEAPHPGDGTEPQPAPQPAADPRRYAPTLPELLQGWRETVAALGGTPEAETLRTVIDQVERATAAGAGAESARGALDAQTLHDSPGSDL